jgi:hypothetical protein
MVETRLVTLSPTNFLYVFLLIVAIAFGVVGVMSGSVGAFCLAAWLGLASLAAIVLPSDVRKVTLTPEHIEIDIGQKVIARADIENVWWKQPAYRDSDLPRKDRFSITLATKNDVVVIPPVDEMTSKELLANILTRWKEPSHLPVPDQLETWALGQEEIFGTEMVWRFHARSLVGGPPKTPAAFRFWIVTVMACICLMAMGVYLMILQDEKSGVVLLPIGIFAGILSSVFAYRSFGPNRFRQPIDSSNWGLVIAPTGLGMIAPKQKGILQWNDVLRIRDKPRFLTVPGDTQRRGLVLEIKGSMIKIPDVWDAPLVILRWLIESNLQPNR